MYKVFRLSLILLLSLLCGCGKNQSVLNFSLPGNLSSNIRVVYYASNKKGGAMMEAVATVINGKGGLTAPMYNPTLLYLYAGGNVPLVVYAERGNKISIKGSENNPDLWEVGGNEINEELSLWRNAHASTLFSGTKEEINEAVADYVMDNRDNPVAAILLLTAFSRSLNEIEFIDLWYNLGEKAEKNRWMRMVSRADMLHSDVRRPGKLLSMALRSLSNGVDTIRPASTHATLLFFWNNGMPNRNTFIDSLKILAKEYPDSSSRMIADISIDPDSISWRSPLRNDSVKNIARFWVPAGLADTRLMDLQVNRTPFFMVLSPDGHQIYRGTDPSLAMKSFRSLMSAEKADSTTVR